MKGLKKIVLIIIFFAAGGYTAGNTTFYQSLFLGGHANLQGYRQFRFADEHMLYNNTEIRIKLPILHLIFYPVNWEWWDFMILEKYGRTDTIILNGTRGQEVVFILHPLVYLSFS